MILACWTDLEVRFPSSRFGESQAAVEVARAVLLLPQLVYGLAFGDLSPMGLTILEAYDTDSGSKSVCFPPNETTGFGYCSY